MKIKIGLMSLALLAVATNASATTKTVTYSFGGYCDGVTLTQTVDKKTAIATGTHFNEDCEGANGNMGGLYGGIKSVGHGLWSAAESWYDGETIVFILDEKAQTWVLYVMGPDSPWAAINTGVLLTGTPKQTGNLRSSTSALIHSQPPKHEPLDTVDYTFADSDGSPYCDGFSLQTSSTDQNGTHTGCTQGDVAGGPRGFVRRVTDKIGRIVYTTDVENAPGVQMAFMVDEGSMAWTLFTMSSADSTILWHRQTSGVLLKGAPDTRVTRKASTSGLVSHAK